MGSLMAGWDSPTLDPKKVTLERNRSLTKEQVEAFRNAHKGSHLFPEEHHHHGQENHSGSKPQSPPISPRFVLHGTEYTVDVDKVQNKDGWWTRSSLAFLNEPVLEEEKRQKSLWNYMPQFHVAQKQ